MPEYLAPGVYVEEIDTGSKPIEGVSTSTGGVVGVTERGPENVPILVTSFGEYTRWFGGYLDPQVFVNLQGANCFLPHAVEGFFTNGGKRVFVVRVLDNLAQFATTFLFDRSAAGMSTELLLPVAVGGTGVYLVDTSGVVANQWLQIGDGSEAEYRQVAAGAVVASHVPLNLPLNRAYPAAAAVVDRFPVAAVALDAALLNSPTALNVGANQITLNAPGPLTGNELIRIGDPANGDEEYIFTGAIAGNTVTLRNPLLLSHPAAVTVRMVIPSLGLPPGVPLGTAPGAPALGDSTTLTNASTGGDVTLIVQNQLIFNAGDLVRISDPAVANEFEIRRVGNVRSAIVSAHAYADYPAHSIVEGVSMNNAAALKTMTAAKAGTNVIALNDRQGLDVGDVVRIGLGAPGTLDVEYLTIVGIPSRLPAPDAGNIVLSGGLQHDHPAGTTVTEQLQPARLAGIQPTALVLGTGRNGDTLLLSGAAGYAVETIAAVRTPAGVFYHRIDSVGGAAPASGLVPLAPPLVRPHSSGASVSVRTPLLRVQALDRGAWGNRLRVTTQDQDPPLLRTQIREVIDATHIRLNSASGIEVGTVLQRTAPNGAFVGAAFKVTNIDRAADSLLTLDAAVPAVQGESVRSMEFQINVLLLRQPDPAVPTRSSQVLDSESFRYLSMDNRHSRYLEKVIGTTWAFGSATDDAFPAAQPLRLEDRRSQGESRYLRVSDLGKPTVATLQSVRLGPELLVDTLPDGRRRPARRALTDGFDAEAAIDDATYIGIDNPEPRLRTGLQSLRNEDEISIVACPGRTSQTLQNRMIEHCEELRYRFAILDAQQPPRDSLNDVQNQRQQYDTKYAALYHPWPLISDPFPTNPAIVKDYAIPPSGHMMGIYARTDIERGVHKAPANEVMRGIVGLQRLLNKGEQDILNPYPVNINVIRDFRPNNRGIRVWGGRVITSDPDWKYVNVRRLLIFIEASLDRGLQWVVFEPNAEPLWARVRRSVSNFLTGVWRDGALEGTKPEEAYFVKVDRTTMTQTDIDNGKLIVVIGVAPVKPAEFVIIRIGLWTAHADS